jgi:hypothetical protein
VLDGSMSQKGTVRDTAFGMVRAGQDSLDRWFARCAAKPDCAFGPDPGAGYDALFAKVRAEQPVVAGTDGKRLTAGLLYQVVLAGLVDYGGTQELAERPPPTTAPRATLDPLRRGREHRRAEAGRHVLERPGDLPIRLLRRLAHPG